MKPINEFAHTVAGKRKKYCRECEATYMRKRRAEKPETVLRSNLKSKYGMSLEDLNCMRGVQDFRCAACLIHEDDVPLRKSRGRPRLDGRVTEARVLDIDHAHNDGARTRALLCPNCNTALGLLGDSPERIGALLRYAEWSEQIDEFGKGPAILSPEGDALWLEHAAAGALDSIDLLTPEMGLDGSDSLAA